MKPVGVRFEPGTLETLERDAERRGHGVGAEVRHAVKAYHALRTAADAALDGESTATLPELMGVKQAAAELGVATGNLGKVAGLPDPLYAPDHPNPRRRIAAGKLYAAEAIRELAARRRSDRGAA